MPPIRAVIERMDGLVSRWDAAGDYRAVFVRSYRLITMRMEQAVADNVFEDSRWMEELDVRFADEYFDALAGHEAGGQVPACWQLAFDVAAERRTLVLQDLLVGMNAHILHDLPISLHKLGIPPAERELRRRDHERVNEVLAGMIDEVQRDLARQYSLTLGVLDRLSGPKDELLTDLGIRTTRAGAWRKAEELSDAPDEAARADIRRRLDQATVAASRLLLARGRWLPRVFRRWDRALAGLVRR